MYILSIIAVVVGTFLVNLFSGQPIRGMLYYLDLPTIIMLLIFTVPSLVAANLVKDFNNAFRLCIKKDKATSMIEIKRAIEAVELFKKTLIVSGTFIAIFSFCFIITELDEPSTIGPKCTVAFLALFYALAINIFLLPISSRLKIRLQEFLSEE